MHAFCSERTCKASSYKCRNGTKLEKTSLSADAFQGHAQEIFIYVYYKFRKKILVNYV